MDMICEVITASSKEGDKRKQKIWKVSFTVVSAMSKMSVVYPLWNLVFYSVYSCKQVEYILVHHVK